MAIELMRSKFRVFVAIYKHCALVNVIVQMPLDVAGMVTVLYVIAVNDVT